MSLIKWGKEWGKVRLRWGKVRLRWSKVRLRWSKVRLRVRLRWGKEKLCNGTQGGTQGGTQDGTQDTQDDTEGDTQMIPKNKYLTSSTIQYLPKTNLGSLLITSKLPMVYERRILVLFSKATFSIYICICVHVFTYSWIHVLAYFSKTTVVKRFASFAGYLSIPPKL